MPVWRRRSVGQKHVVGTTQPPDVARELEYLEEDLQEAEAAAQWYAERSSSAALAFSNELDAAEDAIARNPEAWPSFTMARVGFCFVVFRYLPHRVDTYPDRCGCAWAATARLLEVPSAWLTASGADAQH